MSLLRANTKKEPDQYLVYVPTTVEEIYFCLTVMCTLDSTEMICLANKKELRLVELLKVTELGELESGLEPESRVSATT